MKLETHIHTGEVSSCSLVDAAGAVSRCVELGYDGMVVTDHFAADSYPWHLRRRKKVHWEARVDYFLRGYQAARRAAPAGFAVILGMELRFGENGNDYLVYGLDEDFLYGHEDFDRLGIRRFSELARRSGLLLAQAHPFRFGTTITRPQYLDAVEVYNGHAGHVSHNEIAAHWAKYHGLIPLSGSDFHGGDSGDGTAPGGIILPKPVSDSAALARAIRAGEYTLLPQARE